MHRSCHPHLSGLWSCGCAAVTHCRAGCGRSHTCWCPCCARHCHAMRYVYECMLDTCTNPLCLPPDRPSLAQFATVAAVTLSRTKDPVVATRCLQILCEAATINEQGVTRIHTPHTVSAITQNQRRPRRKCGSSVACRRGPARLPGTSPPHCHPLIHSRTHLCSRSSLPPQQTAWPSAWPRG